jgi:hypothetical protein
MTSVAGTGVAGATPLASGIATQLQIDTTVGIWVSTTQQLYLTGGGTLVRKVDLISGIISTFAGSGTVGYNGESKSLTEVEFSGLTCVWGNSNGDIFLAENNPAPRIRIIPATTSLVSTYAGTGLESADAITANGDGEAATSAVFNHPNFVCGDSVGNIYFSDTNNNKIRKITNTTQIITTVAGTGSSALDTIMDKPATSTAFSMPYGVFADTTGQLFFTAWTTVLKVDLSGYARRIAGQKQTNHKFIVFLF